MIRRLLRRNEEDLTLPMLREAPSNGGEDLCNEVGLDLGGPFTMS